MGRPDEANLMSKYHLSNSIHEMLGLRLWTGAACSSPSFYHISGVIDISSKFSTQHAWPEAWHQHFPWLDADARQDKPISLLTWNRKTNFKLYRRCLSEVREYFTNLVLRPRRELFSRPMIFVGVLFIISCLNRQAAINIRSKIAHGA